MGCWEGRSSHRSGAAIGWQVIHEWRRNGECGGMLVSHNATVHGIPKIKKLQRRARREKTLQMPQSNHIETIILITDTTNSA